jgi:hypothetical protein
MTICNWLQLFSGKIVERCPGLQDHEKRLRQTLSCANSQAPGGIKVETAEQTNSVQLVIGGRAQSTAQLVESHHEG